MKRLAPSGWALIVGCLLVTGGEGRIRREAKGAEAGASGNTDTVGSLAVRIERDPAENPPVIDYDKPLRVALVNNSDQVIRIWDFDTENGYYQISFRFENLRTGEVSIASKRHIDDRKFWKAMEYKTEPGVLTLDIAPRTSLTQQVMDLDNFAWNGRAWTGLPGPNSNDPFAVTVQFESSKPSGPADPTVWTGKVSSGATNARVLASQLKTPHDYLCNGFPRVAIGMMAADPKWISAKDEEFCTPLHHAARYAHKDAVKWLLDHGADVNAIAYNGFTPLHLTDDFDAIELILQKHPDLSIRCRAEGRTPLQKAASNLVEGPSAEDRDHWRRIVKLYMDNDAKYDIFTAIYRDDLKRVEEILNKSPWLAEDFQGKSPLRLATSLGRLEICRYLIETHHVLVDDFVRGNGFPIIQTALAHPRVVELLIKSGADLKTRITWRGFRTGVWIIGDDATALHYAAERGIPETIKLLIDNGVDIFATARDSFRENSDQTALEVAATFGNLDNLNAMVSHPKFDAADRQLRRRLLDKCLHLGANAGPNLVQALLDKGANPDAREDGVTPLQIIAREIHPGDEEENAKARQSIALLRAHGAAMDLFSAVAIGDENEVGRLLANDPKLANSRGPDGYPALHFAVRMNYKNLVEKLVKAGGDVNIRNTKNGTGYPDETALHCAAFWGRYEIAKLLIDAGADVNALTDRDSTPLHDAVSIADTRIARLLLERGANPNARDKKNQTPLDWCRKQKTKNAVEIENLFREYDLRKGK